MRRLLLIVVMLLLPVLTAFPENRFPQPQFETGYAMPATTAPPPRALLLEALDVGVLLASLASSAWLVLKARSRRGVFLLAVFSLAYFGFWRKGCVCPIGSIQNVAAWLGDSQAVMPWSVAAFFLLPLVFALLFGRVFCAAVCPLGAIQEMVVLRPVRLPHGIREALATIPVIYLGASILLAATGVAFLICQYDPFVPIFRLSGNPAIVGGGIALLLLGVVVARPYCRFLCPYGVLLNWMSRLSKWHATVTPGECVRCRLCERACPFDAIRFPTQAVAETRASGVRRLAGLFMLLPVLVVGGGWLGSQCEELLAPLHPVVKLDQVVSAANPEAAKRYEGEVEAFRSSGGSADMLHRSASVIRDRVCRGGAWLGGLLGLLAGLGLIRHSIHRTRRDYEPDRGTCLSCARCFDACPKRQGISSQPA